LLEALGNLPAIRARSTADSGHGNLPLVEIVVAAGAGNPTALQLAARLRAATPAVHVDATNADLGTLILVPTCLRIEDVPLVRSAFAQALAAGA
jgi:hypothetical protein